MRFVAALLLSVFALFFSGNLLFLHTHEIGDELVVHSHPYIPSASHTHSAGSLQTIAQLNQGMGQLELEEVLTLPSVESLITTLYFPDCQSFSIAILTVSAGRAPPVSIS